MDIDKRYCQNRQRKRKRTIIPSPSSKNKNVSPSEEERQFKLRRFVEDVGKFLSEKESCPDQEPKTKSSKETCRAVRKVTLPESKMSRCLFQHNSMQTKLCKRGVMTREMTARLDENLHQIISLRDDNRVNQCQCTLHCKGKIKQQVGLGSLQREVESGSTSVLRTLQPRSPPRCEDSHTTPTHPEGPVGEEEVTRLSGDTRHTLTKSLSDLDHELYPLFTRVVSISSTKTKTKLFKDQSYVSAVKRKLLKIYLKSMTKDEQESSCFDELVKATSCVGTSPFSSPVRTQSSHQNTEQPFKLAPAKFHCQSTMQFLEETIGPSSSSSKQMVPSPVCHQSQPQIFNQPNMQYRLASTMLLSPPVVSQQRHQRVSFQIPKASKYLHEPYLPSSPSVTPLIFKSKVFDGRGDGFKFNNYNSFLPTIEEEEDSPDFRFFP